MMVVVEKEMIVVEVLMMVNEATVLKIMMAEIGVG